MGRPEEALGPAATSTYSTDAEAGRTNDSQETLEVKPIKSWKGYLWDTWDLPQDQRKLLFKVDAFVLTFSSIGYFVRELPK